MMMRGAIPLLFTLGFFVFGCPFAAGAAETSATTSPYLILPDSPVYFVKAISEKIGLWFVFGVENKAKEYVRLADVRLEEYKRLLAKGKDDLARQALARYEEELLNAQEKLKEASGLPQGTSPGVLLRKIVDRITSGMKDGWQWILRVFSILRLQQK